MYHPTPKSYRTLQAQRSTGNTNHIPQNQSSAEYSRMIERYHRWKNNALAKLCQESRIDTVLKYRQVGIDCRCRTPTKYRQVGIAAVLVSVLLKNRYHKLSNFINYIIRYLEPNFTTLGHFKILRNLRILQLFLNFFTSLQSIFCLKISRYNFFQKLAGSNTKKSSLCRKNDTDRHPGIDTTRRIDYFQRSIVRKVSILQSINTSEYLVSSPQLVIAEELIHTTSMKMS